MRIAHTGLYGQSPALWAKYIAGNLEGVRIAHTGVAGNLEVKTKPCINVHPPRRGGAWDTREVTLEEWVERPSITM